MVDQVLIEQLRRMAHHAALRAGQVLNERYTQPRKIKSKGPRDIVTDADSAAQLTAISAILNLYPDHHILAEEDIASRPDEQGQWHIPPGIVWIIDPLDGTTNYASKLPLVSVSVGVAIDGEPVAGAIYDPLRDEMFEAARGMGAALNGQPLLPIPQVSLTDAVICLDWAREPERRSRAVASVDALAPVCRTMRALGSAALGLAYLASGRLQAYFHYGIQPWDCAAGAVMVQEVGGALASPAGEPWHLGEMAMLAGHPGLLKEMVMALAGSRAG
jgi:myo-inositol-1(or 4)-monophosphatase